MNALSKRMAFSVTTLALALVVFQALIVVPVKGIEPETYASLQFSLSESYKSVNLSRAVPGGTLQYTIRIISDSLLPVPASVSDKIPAFLDYVADSEWANAGFVWFSSGSFHWEGTVPPRGKVMIGFEATVEPQAAPGQSITNQANIQDLITGLAKTSSATTVVDIPYTGYDNRGKTAVDGPCGGDGACGATECWEYECSDECES